MGLLNKLTTGQSQLTALNGTTPVTPNFKQSTLHKIELQWRHIILSSTDQS
jgi:hypothetical protein